MINGLGVLGWGVGGIEAEAVMLGQPIYMLTPQVVGFKLTGELPEGATATDLVLTVTQMLRAKGVVDKFVEFYGPGVGKLSLPDRATIANMAPDYGATMGFFPVDAETLRYLALTGRSEELVDLVERYCKEQGLFRTDDTPDPIFTDTLELDMSTVVPSLAGPKRPQDRVALAGGVKSSFRKAFPDACITDHASRITESQVATSGDLEDGSVVLAAITSCTNTSNPSVMVGAGLLAKKAVESGLQAKPWVKTSLAPGSKVVTRYLDAAGLTPYLEALGFYTVGYGCTTCIGNSGPLAEEAGAAVKERNLTVAAVISGNRNFEGRVHPQVRANYLASPPLVVAYALAGTVDIDLTAEPLGADRDGNPVYPPRHLAEPGGDPGRHRQQPERRDVSRASTPTSSAATRPGTRSRSPGAICSRGTTRTAPISRSRRSSSTWPPSRPRRRTSAARGCWRIWATTSPPTTSRRRAASRRTARRDAI